MFPPPLLSERPPAVQALLAIVIPLAYGAFTGYALRHSSGLYVVLTLLSVLGGVAAGFDHATAGEGARRGALGGFLFGVGIVIAHAGAHHTVAKIPHPAILLCVVTCLAGICLGTLGGYFRSRIDAPAA